MSAGLQRNYKDFRETIRERAAQREPKFRKALLSARPVFSSPESISSIASTLRNYINATVGFRQLEEATSIPRQQSDADVWGEWQPLAENLFGVLAHLQAQEGVSFEIRPRRG